MKIISLYKFCRLSEIVTLFETENLTVEHGGEIKFMHEQSLAYIVLVLW